jgi:nitroreductase
VTKTSNAAPDLAERAGYLIELAARAPSVHNTQPWRFTVTGQAIELYADASRQLMEDLTGLQSQPLQSASVRAQIRSSLRATGSPQMLLELGVARTSRPTARRPAGELTIDR